MKRHAPNLATASLAGLVVVVVAVVALADAPAWALCPNCLGQNATLTPTLRIVGVFLLVPPAVFFFVARVIRRGRGKMLPIALSDAEIGDVLAHLRGLKNPLP